MSSEKEKDETQISVCLSIGNSYNVHGTRKFEGESVSLSGVTVKVREIFWPVPIRTGADGLKSRLSYDPPTSWDHLPQSENLRKDLARFAIELLAMIPDWNAQNYETGAVTHDAKTVQVPKNLMGRIKEVAMLEDSAQALPRLDPQALQYRTRIEGALTEIGRALVLLVQEEETK